MRKISGVAQAAGLRSFSVLITKAGRKIFDALKVENACVDWARDFFERKRRECSAAVGISGGKDGSAVAALCADSLGRGGK